MLHCVKLHLHIRNCTSIHMFLYSVRLCITSYILLILFQALRLVREVVVVPILVEYVRDFVLVENCNSRNSCPFLAMVAPHARWTIFTLSGHCFKKICPSSRWSPSCLFAFHLDLYRKSFHGVINSGKGTIYTVNESLVLSFIFT